MKKGAWMLALFGGVLYMAQQAKKKAEAAMLSRGKALEQVDATGTYYPEADGMRAPTSDTTVINGRIV